MGFKGQAAVEAEVKVAPLINENKRLYNEQLNAKEYILETIRLNRVMLESDVPLERICMVELREGADDTLKMECNYKGELALAHQECAIKWFSIKGNKTCERSQSRVLRANGAMHQHEILDTGCGDVPVLVIESMLAYFCFLEQLLVVKLDFLYPSEGIHRRWDNDYYITSAAATWDQISLILSVPRCKPGDVCDETQETLRISQLPSTHVKDDRRKFIWEEVSYLERWWSDASYGKRESFTNLVQNGQLEIVGSGWVINDEVTSISEARIFLDISPLQEHSLSDGRPTLSVHVAILLYYALQLRLSLSGNTKE
ncbi:hypothetical protein L6452_37829 [Arctium lappa]|uniref:Uncharacterized protein n=1 Tax=Arctium lappa TaxID=4217 RepID=A0ACB8Y4J5_ARCLA|nr:hypothetical protein L6452_37829 [Arctium lappa]